tara:strand:- start:356 stop:1408 length:1053 start_codon:yes stop_codon:yes gene_type:complete
MEEGTLVEWTKNDGDDVNTGEVIMLVESDKAVTEVESFDDGIIRIPTDSPSVGTTVPIGTLLAFILQPGEQMPKTRTHTPSDTESTSKSDHAEQTSKTPEPARITPLIPAPASTTPLHRKTRGPAISPRARRIALELGIDWKQLHGSGSSGRIIERDVRTATDRTSATVQGIMVNVTEFVLQHHKLTTFMKRAPSVPNLLTFIIRAVAQAVVESPQLSSSGANTIGVRILQSGIASNHFFQLSSLSVHSIAQNLADDTSDTSSKRVANTALNMVVIDDVDFHTPALDVSSTATLGMGAVQEKVEGHFVNLQLAYDKSVTDDGARKLINTMRLYMENPYTWLSWQKGIKEQ